MTPPEPCILRDISAPRTPGTSDDSVMSAIGTLGTSEAPVVLASRTLARSAEKKAKAHNPHFPRMLGTRSS